MRGVNLLGEDGKGYELALKLEGFGAWKAWFNGGSGGGGYGDDYSKFVNFLSSPSSWDSFMSSSPPVNSNSTRQILHLQLRARALLFDKASISLFLPSSHKDDDDESLSHLNPQYLHLHGDDIFFTLEPEDDEDDDECDIKLDSKKPTNIINNKKKNNNNKNNADANSYQVHSRLLKKGNEKHPCYDERSSTTGSQRHSSSNRNEVLSKTWHNQYMDKLRVKYPKFPNCGKELLERTTEGMSAYLHNSDTHKRKRKAFLQDKDTCLMENGSCDDKDLSFFPEITFPSNCVPASALPLKYKREKNQNDLEFHGILDNLPNVTSKSTAMMERFGIKPDYIKVGSKYRGVDGSGCEKKSLCHEQALLMTQKVIVRLLSNTGFEGGTANSMEVFAEFFRDRICKLGRTLKLLTDSYRKQYSSIELLQMFLQIIGHSNLGALEESKTDGNKGHRPPSQVRAVQPLNQNSLLQAQQVQRQMQTQPNMNAINLPKMTFQPQMRRQQSGNQLMPDVKIENTMELSPIEGPTLNSTLSKQQQQQLQQQRHMLQMRQQQHQLLQQHMPMPQSTQQQFRHLQSAQIHQPQMQNGAYGMRTRPIKVEGYPDILAEDSTVKHDSDHNQLASPSK